MVLGEWLHPEASQLQTCAKPHTYSNDDLADRCDEVSQIFAVHLSKGSDRFGHPERVPTSAELVEAARPGDRAVIQAAESLWIRETDRPQWAEHSIDAAGICIAGRHAIGMTLDSARVTPTTVVSGASPPQAGRLAVLDLSKPDRWVDLPIPIEPSSVSCGASGAIIAGGPGIAGRLLRLDDSDLEIRELRATSGSITGRTSTLGRGELALLDTFEQQKAGALLVDPAGEDVRSFGHLSNRATYLSVAGGAAVSVGRSGSLWSMTKLTS